MFEPAEATFNEVAMRVQMLIVSAQLCTIGAWRNDGNRLVFGNIGKKRMGVIRFVGHDRACGQASEQRDGLRDIMHLSSGQAPTHSIAQTLHHGVDLGGQPAARAPERLVTVFFAAPAACWWARTMVLSMNTSSKSASLANSSKTRCQTPRSDQRANRLYTEFHCPKLLGRSRHGQPARAIHNTASTNRRLSSPVRPGSKRETPPIP